MSETGAGRKVLWNRLALVALLLCAVGLAAVLVTTAGAATYGVSCQWWEGDTHRLLDLATALLASLIWVVLLIHMLTCVAVRRWAQLLVDLGVVVIELLLLAWHLNVTLYYCL